jgi:hypothetical protein
MLTDRTTGVRLDVRPLSFVGAVGVAPGEKPPLDSAWAVLEAPTEEALSDLKHRFTDGARGRGLEIRWWDRAIEE